LIFFYLSYFKLIIFYCCSLKRNRLKTHPLRHLRIPKILLLLTLIHLNIHFIIFFTIVTILTWTMFPTLHTRRIARAVLFVTFCLFTCTKSQFVGFYSLKCIIPLLTVLLILTCLTATILWTKLAILETFAIWFQALCILTVTLKPFCHFFLLLLHLVILIVWILGICLCNVWRKSCVVIYRREIVIF